MATSIKFSDDTKKDDGSTEALKKSLNMIRQNIPIRANDFEQNMTDLKTQIDSLSENIDIDNMLNLFTNIKIFNTHNIRQKHIELLIEYLNVCTHLLELLTCSKNDMSDTRHIPCTHGETDESNDILAFLNQQYNQDTSATNSHILRQYLQGYVQIDEPFDPYIGFEVYEDIINHMGNVLFKIKDFSDSGAIKTKCIQFIKLLITFVQDLSNARRKKPIEIKLINNDEEQTYDIEITQVMSKHKTHILRDSPPQSPTHEGGYLEKYLKYKNKNNL